METLLDAPIRIPAKEPAPELWPTPIETAAPQIAWRELDRSTGRITARAQMPLVHGINTLNRLTLFRRINENVGRICQAARSDVKPKVTTDNVQMSNALNFISRLDVSEDVATQALTHADQWLMLTFGRLPLINPCYPDYVGAMTRTLYFNPARHDAKRTELRAKLSLVATALLA